MADTGLGILSGLLGGLQGLPQGMVQREKFDQTQQQLDELARHNQAMEKKGTQDVYRLFNMLGMSPPPGVTPGTMAVDSTANLILQHAQAQQERERLQGVGQDLANRIRATGTTTTMQPGTTLSMPEPGQVVPRTAAPMGAVAQRTVNPQMESLAQLVPGLLQLDKPAASTLIQQALAPKPMVVPETSTLRNPVTGAPIGPEGAPRPKVEIRPGAGDQFAVTLDPRTGAPIGTPTPLGIGAPESKGVYTRADIEDQLRLEDQAARAAGKPGLPPGSLAYRQRYNDLARQVQVAPGGQVFGAGTGLGNPPAPAPAPAPTSGPLNPPLPAPAAQQPAVQAAGAELGRALDNQNAIRAGLPGVPPPAAPATGPRPLIERPPSATEASHYVNRETLQPPPTGMTLTQIQQSGQYVQVPAASIPAVKQLNTVKSMLAQAENAITKRPDLFPPSTGNVLRDNLNVGIAWGRFKAGAKTDPDIGNIDSLKIALPSAIKAFGDTANVAVAERQVSEQALGLGPATRESALARIRAIRELANSGAAASGFPNLLGPPTASGAPPDSKGKVRVQAPDGTPGTWDLSKGPVPPGFKRIK